MSRRCPWCLEPLALGERKATTCPHCQRPLDGPDGEPRELDLRYQQIEDRQRSRFKEVLQWGVPTIAVTAVAASLLNVGAVFLAPLTAMLHLIALRVWLVRDARRHLGPTRRLFNRWVARFAFLWLGLPGYAAMAVPLLGIVVAVATFVALTAIVHTYTAWGLSREYLRQPTTVWEKTLIIGLAVLTLIVVAAILLGVLLLGWSVWALTTWLWPE